MRTRVWVALGCLAAAIAAALLPESPQLRLAAGALLAAALVLGATLLPFWRRLPRIPPMPELKVCPRASERWCARCGRPAPARGPCPTCGVAAARERRRLRRLQRKQRAQLQEKKT